MIIGSLLPWLEKGLYTSLLLNYITRVFIIVKRIVIIQGHPDPESHHFGHALEEAYLQGAQNAGHDVQSIHIAELDCPLLRKQIDYEHNTPSELIRRSQEMIRSADHLVILLPSLARHYAGAFKSIF